MLAPPLAKASLPRAVLEYHSNPKLYILWCMRHAIWVCSLILQGLMAAADFNWSDIFWTFTSGSLWNTTFKLLFLSSSLYTVYLMLNDYKPTHDPNIDTFKVEYLLGASFVLAVLFPREYKVAEVSIPFISTHNLPYRELPDKIARIYTDLMDLFDLARIRRHITTVVHATANW